jgi:flagellum-specific peptidoglycan hydrolase FlgJ
MSQVDKYAEYLSHQAKKESVFQTKHNPNDINTRVAEATGKKVASKNTLNESSDYTFDAEKSAFSGGWRAKVVNPSGKVSYLSQQAFKNKEDAIDHAQKYHQQVNIKGRDSADSPERTKLIKDHPHAAKLVKSGWKAHESDDDFVTFKHDKNPGHMIMLPHSEKGVGSKLSYQIIPGKKDDFHIFVQKAGKELVKENQQLDEVYQAIGAALARGIAAVAPRAAAATSAGAKGAKSITNTLLQAVSDYGPATLGRMGHVNFHVRLDKDEKGNFSPKFGASAYNPTTGDFVTSDPKAYSSGRAYPAGHPFRRVLNVHEVGADSSSSNVQTAGESQAKTQSAPAPTQKNEEFELMVNIIENELIDIYDNHMLNEEAVDIHEIAPIVGAIARMGLGLLGKALKSPKAMSALSYLAPMIAGSKPANRDEASKPLPAQIKPTSSISGPAPIPRPAPQPKVSTSGEQAVQRPKKTASGPQSFYNQMYSAAKKAGHQFPELTAAQAAIETGWGKSMSAQNNPFGQKGKPGRDSVTYKKTWEVEGGKKVTRKEPFKNYETLEDAMKDRAQRWEPRMKGAKDPYEAIDMIARRYATDPNYSSKVKQIMKKYSQNVGQ